MSAHSLVPSIAGLDIRTAERTATCQDCDWTADGTATAPLAAAHAADEDHEVVIDHFLDLATHPGNATDVSPLNTSHSNFDAVEFTQVDVFAWCNTDGCGCNFSAYDNPLTAALTHGQRYNHDTHARISLTVGVPKPNTDTANTGDKKEIIASLY